ncbi:MAG: thioredoxin domain-containing protein, partial [Aliifodinibius sp.]|nr:DsbA family protein [Fodinibius sp.]NIV12722.1 thioredoxin domain-containing protein [Fodinibius sp.]NIY30105.1 thioredoxin domain-containing protein [Fodinibius sp.]
VGAPDLATLDTYDDIQVGFTEDGYPFRGSPNAPITIIEYSDYLCPFCGRYTSDTAPILLTEYVQTGKVRFIFRDFPLASLHPTAHFGHIAALCVGEQGPGLYWKMHDALFALQDEWSRLPDPTDFLSQTAEEVGADIPSYEQCVNSGKKEAAVTKSVEETRNLGFNSTPSFQMVNVEKNEVYPLIGAQPVDVFSNWLDALLVGNQPPVEPTDTPPEPPYWMSAEGLIPDPDRPGFTIAGDPYKGNPESEMV